MGSSILNFIAKTVRKAMDELWDLTNGLKICTLHF